MSDATWLWALRTMPIDMRAALSERARQHAEAERRVTELERELADARAVIASVKQSTGWVSMKRCHGLPDGTFGKTFYSAVQAVWNYGVTA